MTVIETNSELFFEKFGYVVVKIPEIHKHIAFLAKEFEAVIRPRFKNDITSNRTLIKRFAESPGVMSIYQRPELLKLLKDIAGITYPVYCGPVVSHYTANDLTGSGYGIPWHQDYPSMGSSQNSVICWVALSESGPDTHGLNILPGCHKRGLLEGTQRDRGYEIDLQESHRNQDVIPELAAGDVIIMSSYTPHRTYVNESYSGWKLSFSHRFDCLNDADWMKRGYVNAYNISVDRELYLK